MDHIDICDIFKGTYTDKRVSVCGWVRTSRESKNVAFIELNDGTSLNHLQIVLDKELFTKETHPEVFHVGAAIKVLGKVIASESKAQTLEINAVSIEVLGKSPSGYPLQKKRHTLEYLRTIPHLRVRTNTFNAVFRVRSKLSQAIHTFFQERNFVYIHTPIITSSDCEGAGEVFKVTSIGFSQEYKTAEDYYSDDFFGKRVGLTVSGQLEGEVAAMAMGKIYTFGPTFRAENSNTPRHAAEFWQIEPEVAFAKLPDIIEVAESLIKYLIDYALVECKKELEFFERHFESGLIEKLENVSQSSFEILDYKDAIDTLRKADVEFNYPVEWGNDLQTEHERYITEKVFGKPVFVINYPKKIKSFYMKQNDDGETVAATDLLVPGVGEIIGCSEREDNYDKLLHAIIERGMKTEDYQYYLDLRKFGTAPHSGFGLGLERLLMYITGVNNIRDVTLYPRTPGEIK